MKTEIKTISLTRMRQAEDYSFHSLALAEMKKCEEPSFADVLSAYETAFAAFDKELKTTGGENPLTKDVAEADTATDRCYTGMVAATRALLYHYEPNIAELARRMLIIIDRYGNPTNLGYLQAYGILDNLLQDLREFDTEDISNTEEGTEEEEPERPGGLSLTTQNLATLGLDGWVTQLQQCHDRFMDVFARRNAQQAPANSGESRVTRKAVDDTYRSAVKRLNALIEINGIATYETLVANLNNLIDRQKSIHAARISRSASKNNSSEEEEKPGEL